MEMERALETQQGKLLRLLAGWFAVVGFMSLGPLRVELPQWMRAFLDSVLIRAEFAAQNLIWVAAYVAAKKGMGGTAGLRPRSIPFLKPVDSLDPVPSTQALLRRMKALRRLLETLPRQGVRMLRRRARNKLKRSFWGTVWPVDLAPALSRVCGLVAPRIERPPD